MKSQQLAPVFGFALSFISGEAIEGARISTLNNDQVYFTDKNGRFGPIYWPVGNQITLVLEKKGFRTTQSATITVPPEGLTHKYNNISFQVPSEWAYQLFSFAIGIKADPNACQIATTITAFKKTMEDIPQGEPGARVIVTGQLKHKPVYLGLFNKWPLKHKTNPFARSHTMEELTSHDGGVLFQVDPSDEPFNLTAEKLGVRFSEVKVLPRKGVFINISPPHGPSVQYECDGEDKEEFIPGP